MEQTNSNISSDPGEKLFNQYMKTAEDFKKIEIYRLAKSWYEKALETGINRELATSNIRVMNKRLKQERKIILTLLAIAVVIAGSVYFITVI